MKGVRNKKEDEDEEEEEEEEKEILTNMKKLKMNMRYLMQLRQSPSMAVLLAEASPCPFGDKTRRSSA